eukprot:m.271531 g.271531  ORF g.271531 m.271531 type:complete len:685 (+) comp15683_c2_seq3:424-2478(+)
MLRMLEQAKASSASSTSPETAETPKHDLHPQKGTQSAEMMTPHPLSSTSNPMQQTTEGGALSALASKVQLLEKELHKSHQLIRTLEATMVDMQGKFDMQLSQVNKQVLLMANQLTMAFNIRQEQAVDPLSNLSMEDEPDHRPVKQWIEQVPVGLERVVLRLFPDASGRYGFEVASASPTVGPTVSKIKVDDCEQQGLKVGDEIIEVDGSDVSRASAKGVLLTLKADHQKGSKVVVLRQAAGDTTPAECVKALGIITQTNSFVSDIGSMGTRMTQPSVSTMSRHRDSFHSQYTTESEEEANELTSSAGIRRVSSVSSDTQPDHLKDDSTWASLLQAAHERVSPVAPTSPVTPQRPSALSHVSTASPETPTPLNSKPVKPPSSPLQIRAQPPEARPVSAGTTSSMWSSVSQGISTPVAMRTHDLPQVSEASEDTATTSIVSRASEGTIVGELSKPLSASRLSPVVESSAQGEIVSLTVHRTAKALGFSVVSIADLDTDKLVVRHAQPHCELREGDVVLEVDGVQLKTLSGQKQRELLMQANRLMRLRIWRPDNPQDMLSLIQRSTTIPAKISTTALKSPTPGTSQTPPQTQASQRSSKLELVKVELKRASSTERLGLKLVAKEHGVTVGFIHAGHAAARSGLLRLGDVLVSVNSQSVQGMYVEQVKELLGSDVLELVVERTRADII